MKHSNEHFKCVKALGKEKFDNVEPLLRQKIASEVAAAQRADDVRSVAKLSAAEVTFLARDMPLVKQPSDIAGFPNQVGKKREFGFSPLFCPALVDHCCLHGIFPLALEVKRGVFVFAPKLHVERAVVRLVDEPLYPIPSVEEGPAVFDPRNCQAKTKLAHKCVFYVNRPEDVADALALIHLQHGENWLCAPLRACVVDMLRRPHAYETKIVLFAIREKAPVAGEGESPLIAAELGYIVGDIYTSATGAYCVSGCGTLQLAVLGAWLQRIGVKVWDLGMQMAYKERCLGCVVLPRNKWLQLVEKRRTGISREACESIALALSFPEPQPCIVQRTASTKRERVGVVDNAESAASTQS